MSAASFARLAIEYRRRLDTERVYLTHEEQNKLMRMAQTAERMAARTTTKTAGTATREVR